MSTAKHRLAKLFDPHHPLYLRKLTTVSQLTKALTDIAEVVAGDPAMAICMTLGLYEAHKDLYHQLALERQQSVETITSQLAVMRTDVKGVSDTTTYTDYLIAMWSATGDLQHLIELTKRRQSLIEEVSVSATWTIDTISEGSEVFKHAIATAVASN